MNCIEMDAIDIFESFKLTEAEKLILEVSKTKFTNYFTPTKSVSYSMGLLRRKSVGIYSTHIYSNIQANKCDKCVEP
jgi:hypothetical protein